MKIITHIYDLEHLDSAVDLIIEAMNQCSIITLTGTLGAGKTTLVQAVLRRLGVTEEITSPTFTYVNLYHADGDATIYHFDLYRLSSPDEFIDQGFHEYLEQPNSWSFIEWPDVIAPLINARACHVYLDYLGEKRSMKIVHPAQERSTVSG